jgi:hypothetical protein
MRTLRIAVIVMGVLIVAGTAALVVAVARRASAPVVAALPPHVTSVLDEPSGTRIAGIVALRDRLAVQLQNGGTDRVVLIDPATGAVTGRISLAR